MIKIFAAIGAFQVFAILFTLGRAKIIAIMVGPEGMGIISVIDQIVQSASYAGALSLPFASLKFLSQAHSESVDSFRRSYSAFFKGLLMLSCLVTLVVTGLIVINPEVLGTQVIAYRQFILVAILSLPAMMLGGLASNTLAASDRPYSAAILSVITAAGFMMAAYVGLYFAGIRGFYWANLAVNASITLSAIVYLRHKLGLRIMVPGAGVLAEIRRNPRILSFSLMMFITSISHSVAFLVVRYRVLSEHGEVQAGLLHALLAIALAIGAVLSQVNGFYLTPKVNRHVSRPEKIAVANHFLETLLVILSAVSVGFALFPDIALTILFSGEFAGVAYFLVLFVAAQAVFQIAGVYQSLLVGFDDMRAFVGATAISHVVLAVTSWYAAAQLGIIGVGIAYGLSGLTLLVLAFARLRARHGLVYPKRTIFGIGYGGTGCIIAWFLANQLPGFSVLAVGVKLSAFVLFVAGSLAMLGHKTRQEFFEMVGLSFHRDASN